MSVAMKDAVEESADLHVQRAPAVASAQSASPAPADPPKQASSLLATSDVSRMRLGGSRFGEPHAAIPSRATSSALCLDLDFASASVRRREAMGWERGMMSSMTGRFGDVVLAVKDLDSATDHYARMLGRMPSFRSGAPVHGFASVGFSLSNASLALDRGSISACGAMPCLTQNSSILLMVAGLPRGEAWIDFWPSIIGESVALTLGTAPTK